MLTLAEVVHSQQYLDTHYKLGYTFMREAVNFLAIINSSINFVIYCIFGKDFRKELVVVYGCGTTGITLMLPVHDKFSTWRQNLKVRKSQASSRHSSTPNLQNIGMKQFTELFVGKTSGVASPTGQTSSDGDFRRKQSVGGESTYLRVPNGNLPSINMPNGRTDKQNTTQKGQSC